MQPPLRWTANSVKARAKNRDVITMKLREKLCENIQISNARWCIAFKRGKNTEHQIYFSNHQFSPSCLAAPKSHILKLFTLTTKLHEQLSKHRWFQA